MVILIKQRNQSLMLSIMPCIMDTSHAQGMLFHYGQQPFGRSSKCKGVTGSSSISEMLSVSDMKLIQSAMTKMRHASHKEKSNQQRLTGNYPRNCTCQSLIYFSLKAFPSKSRNHALEKCFCDTYGWVTMLELAPES